MTLDELDTPAIAIDLDRVERNIAAAQRYCDEHGLALRPHIKTHKLPALAHKQLAAGARGITAQKTSEAAVMAAAGCDDILLSYNVVGEQKLAPLARLAASVRRLALALDNTVAIELAERAAALAGKPIEVLVEFESGRRRTGVLAPAQALELAKQIDAKAHLRFAGLMSYPVNRASGAWVEEAKALFAREGIELEHFSGGGTPGMWQSHEVAHLSELRVGTYVYHDRATVGAGAASLDDCALHVHATVVSVPERGRAVIDAGSKTLSSDLVAPEVGPGYGLVLEYPDAVVAALSEEHGVLDTSRCERSPRVGERVRVVPNHVCVVTNLHDEVFAHRRGQVQAAWPIWARGKTQ